MATIGLPDGRLLDIEVSGPESGTPLFFHHGTPGAVVQFRSMADAVAARGLRLVTYSRAGYGASTRRPGRTVADVVPDVRAVLDHLGADRCLVAGWSGGGPHALATAALLPDRVGGVLVMAGVGPSGVPDLDFLAGMGEENLVEFGKAVDGEPALRDFLDSAGAELREVTPGHIVEALSSLLPDVDRAVLTDQFAEDTARSFREAVRPGIDGWLDDDLAFTRPWGFDLADVSVPAFVWQGSDDLMVPFAHGHWLAAHVPGATVHLEAGEGHLSIIVAALDRMLDELVTTL